MRTLNLIFKSNQEVKNRGENVVFFSNFKRKSSKKNFKNQ